MPKQFRNVSGSTVMADDLLQELQIVIATLRSL